MCHDLYSNKTVFVVLSVTLTIVAALSSYAYAKIPYAVFGSTVTVRGVPVSVERFSI